MTPLQFGNICRKVRQRTIKEGKAHAKSGNLEMEVIYMLVASFIASFEIAAFEVEEERQGDE